MEPSTASTTADGRTVAGECTWKVLRGKDDRLEIVDAYDTLDEAIVEMSKNWDDSSNAWGNFIVSVDSGEVVAVAIYAGGELLVTTADGRRLAFGELDAEMEAEE